MMAHRYKKAVLLLAWVLVLGTALWAVAGMERIVRHGQPVLVELAPVDPRSLMQGDYMDLAFAIDRRDLRNLRGVRDDGRLPRYVYLKLDAERRSTFAGAGDTLPAPDGQVALRLRPRDRWPGVSIGPNAFFFQEGQGAVFEHARWGELRVADDGRALLTALYDEALQVLGVQRR